MNDVDESTAKRRFMMLNLVRLGGLALILAAIAISQKMPEISFIFTIALALGGLSIFHFVPRRLAKQWKSEDQ